MLSRLRHTGPTLLATLVTFAAAAGCVLPWERIAVPVSSSAQVRPLGSFHGTGLAACLGAALALLMLADRVLRPAPSAIRDAGRAVAGTLLALGAGLFTLLGGYAPGTHAGTVVSIEPGLYVAGGAGVLLLLSALLPAAGRRAGSRSRASSAAPARP